MNYTTIEIEGQKIGLKFGMASFRYLQTKFVDGVSFNGSELNEIGIAHILYSGYYNNCIIKDIIPSLSFENFVDFIEQNLKNEDKLNEIKTIIELWTKNDFIKSLDKANVEETKKKTTRGKK
jgi:hypothetical protein